MKKVVFLDLDGTIIEGQSQKILAKYLLSKGKVDLLFLAVIIFWFFLYKRGFIKSPDKVMRASCRVAKNWETGELREIMDDFYKNELQKKVRNWFQEKIEEYRNNDYLTVLVTNAIKPIAEIVKENLLIDFELSSELEVVNDKYTGEIIGNIMYGEEKERAIISFLDKNGFSLEDSAAYSDHVSDLPMLELVERPCVVNPDKDLLAIAQKRGWEIINFNSGE